MSDLLTALAAVGGLLFVLGTLAGLVKEVSFVSEPMVSLLAGLIGPAALGLLDLADFGAKEKILEVTALLTLAIALMGVALRLPEGFSVRNWRRLGVLLGLVMPFMWISSALLMILILDLPLWTALPVGAVVTPTDPVVASSIVTGGVAERNLPARLRHTISAESGFNDGLALPFVVLPIFGLLGMSLPWEGWGELGWSGLLLVVAVLLLRRMPAILALRHLLGPLRNGRDAHFLGWFGPVGVAALYYATFSLREAGVEEVWTVSSLIICASVLVHGATATWLTKLYGRLAGATDGDAESGR